MQRCEELLWSTERGDEDEVYAQEMTFCSVGTSAVGQRAASDYF